MRVRESRRVRWVNERQRVGVGDAPLSVSDYQLADTRPKVSDLLQALLEEATP